MTESVLINKVEEGKLINSKSEWNYASSLRASSLFGSHARFILGASGGGRIGAGLKSGRERIGAGAWGELSKARSRPNPLAAARRSRPK